jgi:hypothetical protein
MDSPSTFAEHILAKPRSELVQQTAFVLFATIRRGVMLEVTR